MIRITDRIGWLLDYLSGHNVHANKDRLCAAVSERISSLKLLSPEQLKQLTDSDEKDLNINGNHYSLLVQHKIFGNDHRIVVSCGKGGLTSFTIHFEGFILNESGGIRPMTSAENSAWEDEWN